MSVRGLELIGEIRDGQQFVFLRDRLDSVRVVTNSIGAIVTTFAYDAFGNLVKSTGISATTYRYAAEPRSAVSGLDHLRARSYDPATGRFVAADSFAGRVTVPISRNRYIYASSDPVNHTDPSGNESLVETQAAAGIVTVLTTTAIGAGYGFVKAKIFGQDVRTEVLKYGALGFVIGIAVTYGIPGFTSSAGSAASTAARVEAGSGGVQIGYVLGEGGLGATTLEIAGFEATVNLEVLGLVMNLLKTVPWYYLGGLAGVNVVINCLLALGGEVHSLINRVETRVENQRQQ